MVGLIWVTRHLTKYLNIHLHFKWYKKFPTNRMTKRSGFCSDGPVGRMTSSTSFRLGNDLSRLTVRSWDKVWAWLKPSHAAFGFVLFCKGGGYLAVESYWSTFSRTVEQSAEKTKCRGGGREWHCHSGSEVMTQRNGFGWVYKQENPASAFYMMVIVKWNQCSWSTFYFTHLFSLQGLCHSITTSDLHPVLFVLWTVIQSKFAISQTVNKITWWYREGWGLCGKSALVLPWSCTLC